MQKLHLVGFTTDSNGLILSARRGARSGGYTLVLDDALAQAVDDLRARLEEEAEAAGLTASNRPESRLPIGEIQTRLRRGRSLKDVAKEAGVEPEWVERFAAPVFAERAEVVSRVQGAFYKRQRLGPSGMRIGDAVRRNLAERGVVMAPSEYDESWKAVQRPDGRWIVTFAFQYRGAARTLKFEARPDGEVIGADQLTAQMAYITPPKRPAPRPRPPAPTAEDPSPKRAVVSSGFRPEPVVKAASRPGKEREKAHAAMTKAAARRAVEGEKAALRKAREREQMLARKAREAAAEAQRRQREISARAREAAAAARLAAAEEAERERAAQEAAAARTAEREAARRAARLKVKADSKAVAAKRAAAGRADKATTAKAAAAVRAADGTPATRRPPRPKADARVDAPPPPRAARSAGATKAAGPARASAPAKAPAKASVAKAVAKATAPRPPASASPRPAAAPAAEVVASEAVRPRPSIGDLAREVRGEAPRPQFRTGAATLASGVDEPTAAVPAVRPAEAPPQDGSARRRPPGLRRTRQLRAE